MICKTTLDFHLQYISSKTTMFFICPSGDINVHILCAFLCWNGLFVITRLLGRNLEAFLLSFSSPSPKLPRNSSHMLLSYYSLPLPITYLVLKLLVLFSIDRFKIQQFLLWTLLRSGHIFVLFYWSTNLLKYFIQLDLILNLTFSILGDIRLNAVKAWLAFSFSTMQLHPLKYFQFVHHHKCSSLV